MGLDKSLSGQNHKLDCGPVQGQMLNHGLDRGKPKRHRFGDFIH